MVGAVLAKRFTDTEKWKRTWFEGLPTLAKLVWFYVLDNCDHAGVWPMNFKLLSYQLGEPVTRSEFENWFGDKAKLFEGDKYFIPSFVEFQYGKLNPANNAHLSVIKILEKVNVKEVLMSPSRGALDQDQEMDKDQDQDKDQEKEGGVGETKTHAVTSGEAAACLDEWRTTLKHFEINRGVGIRDEVAIGKAISSFGHEWVKLALQGARKQTSGPRFDPKKFVSLSIYLHKDRIERLVNIGAGNETSADIDWTKVFGGAA